MRVATWNVNSVTARLPRFNEWLELVEPDVVYDSRGATTQSLVMRSRSGTVRRIDARHRLVKLREYASVEFG